MTTPTKEQIEKVAKVIYITHRPKPMSKYEYIGLCDYWDRILSENAKYRYRARAQMAIETWEKIRNSPK